MDFWTAAMTFGSRARPLESAVLASRMCWLSRWRVILARALSFSAMPMALWIVACLACSASASCFQLAFTRFWSGSQKTPWAAGMPSSIASGGSGGGLRGRGIGCCLCGDVCRGGDIRRWGDENSL